MQDEVRGTAADMFTGASYASRQRIRPPTATPMLGFAHEKLVYGRRIEILARHLCELLPRNASALDVGAGDGLLARRIMDARPDVTFTGVDVLVRPRTHIPVVAYDGLRLPFGDHSFDAITIIDVVHHAADPGALLTEAARVSRGTVVIKDHLLRGWLAGPTLRFMDAVGNARHGVRLPYNYWTDQQWRAQLERSGLTSVERRDRLHLYPWPFSLLFDRGLHFVGVFRGAPA